MLHYVTAAQITNVGKYRVVSKTPAECSDEELKNFATVLAEGGQVAISGMMTRIKLAKSLGFAYNEDGELVGVSALKVPLEAYRRQVESGAGVSLPSSEYPYDVGWLYVKPEYRGAKAGQMLRYLLVQPVLGINAGAFATIRHDNFMPQRIITKYGFERAGHVWTSEKTGNAIDLFVRDADKGALQSVASAEIEYEAIYMSPALASMLSDSHVEAMCLRVPSLACVAASALSLGYTHAGSDLAVAIATEDADLAAHALNLLHTDVEADIHKKDPDFKIIGDIESAPIPHDVNEEEHGESCSCPACTGAPNADGPEAIEKIGLMFQAAIAPAEEATVKDLAALVSGIPAAREDLNNVELGVTPSYHTVCLEHLGRLGCPDIGAIESIVKAPDVSLDMNEAHEVFLRLDSDIRGKLSEAEGPEADRLQRVLINLETLMSDIFHSNVALASEYVPFGDVIHRNAGIRVVGIRPLTTKTGVWEIITHYLDGITLKSIASNKRSLGLCINMLKPDTKINFRGTMGRVVKDGILLQDGRELKLLGEEFANDKTAPVTQVAKEGSPAGTVASVATASATTDRLYAKIEERLKSNKPALRTSAVTISELAGAVLIVIQDVVLKPDALSKIVGRTVVDKTKTFDRSSGAEFELEKTPGKFGRVGDVSIKINTGNGKQIQDALGLIKRLFNNSLSYGGNTIAEATAATEDLRTQAIHEICTSLTRTIDRSRNMFSAISVLAKQESAGDGIVEIPETVKIAIAKCYEGFSNVEVFVFRQLDQDKAVLEPGYKDLSKEESKAVASLFIPLYRNRKVSAYRTALYTVADAFGTSKPRVPGDLIKLAQTLPPACDFLEAGVNRIVSSLDNANTATASLEGTDSSLYTNFTGFELDRENNIPDRNKYVGLVENQIVVLLQDKFGNIETKLPFKLLNGKNELPAFHVKTTKDWKDLQERIHRAFDLGM